VLIEGPAGTGKTALAKAVADSIGARLVRLQCYEGLDESKALYEWNYRQATVARIQAGRPEGDGHRGVAPTRRGHLREEFMLNATVARSHHRDRSVVLLIDEVDRGGARDVRR